MIILKSEKQIELIRNSCKLVALVLSELKQKIEPGISTIDLNNLAECIILDNKAIPGFKGYLGFPYSICASVNEEIVHGFPNDNPLKYGDIVSIDFGAVLNGWYSDSAFTAIVGDSSKQVHNLVNVTRDCLYAGILNAIPYRKIGDITSAIQHHAETNGFFVAEEFVGHGVGKNLHEEPQIPNYGILPGDGQLLLPGMVIAIEPIVTERKGETHVLSNGWTVSSRNRGLAAHFEHTLVVTDDGPEILTTLGSKSSKDY
jgi:methionyl aminopeptidase